MSKTTKKPVKKPVEKNKKNKKNKKKEYEYDFIVSYHSAVNVKIKAASLEEAEEKIEDYEPTDEQILDSLTFLESYVTGTTDPAHNHNA